MDYARTHRNRRHTSAPVWVRRLRWPSRQEITTELENLACVVLIALMFALVYGLDAWLTLPAGAWN